MKNQIKKLKNFLCRIGLHNWNRLEDDTRKCQWCPKHQEIEDWDAAPMGGIDIEWRDIV